MENLLAKYNSEVKVTIYFVLFLIFGFVFFFSNQTNAYYDIASYYDKIQYANNKEYLKFFTSTSFSTENSILFSILILLGKSNLLLSFRIYNFLFSVLLYVTCYFIVLLLKKSINKNSILLLAPLACMFCFAAPYSSSIETKIVLSGIAGLYLTSKINDEKTRRILYMCNLVFLFNIIYVFILGYKFVVKYGKKVAVLPVICFALYVFLLTSNMISFAGRSLLEAGYLTVFPNISFMDTSFQIVFGGVILIFIAAIGIVILADDISLSKIIFALISVFIILYAVLTNEDSVYLSSALHMYLSFLLWIEIAMFPHLRLEKKLHFSTILSMISMVAIVTGFISFFFYRDSKEELLYRIKYDCDYSLTSHEYQKNCVDYAEMSDEMINLKVKLNYEIPSNKELTSFRNPDILMYGLGKVEDDNGSRWSINHAAVNMYSEEGQTLYISMYNPEGQVGSTFHIYVDNVLEYDGITTFGGEVCKLGNDYGEGNHIVKIIIDEPDTNLFCMYVTNIGFYTEN